MLALPADPGGAGGVSGNAGAGATGSAGAGAGGCAGGCAGAGVLAANLIAISARY